MSLARWLGLAALLRILTGGAPAEGKGPPSAPGRRIGLWWDISGGNSVSGLDRYLAELREAHVNDLSIVVQDHGPRVWHLTWDLANLKTFIDACRGRGIRCGIMLWPEPSRAWYGQFAKHLPALMEAGPDYIEFDAEGNWQSSRLDGFSSLRDAAVELVRIARAGGVELQCTTYPYGAARVADLIQRVDAFAVQAYSQSDADEEGRADYGWGRPLGPGGMQDVAMRKAQEAGAARVIMGLAAYDQVFPGHTANEAMRVAYEAAVKHTSEVRYWSGKWTVGYPGRTPNSYVLPFLRSL